MDIRNAKPDMSCFLDIMWMELLIRCDDGQHSQLFRGKTWPVFPWDRKQWNSRDWRFQCGSVFDESTSKKTVQNARAVMWALVFETRAWGQPGLGNF